ncbi:hypothetical protein [Shewanella livingstonensis]|uniref:Uncharacterized protein n=1 Tax=Shewanella livingstonensis TaxID=150120 RepID=A0A3G8M0P7_9GAMM|nr:hypothetical protein [Shewanella livingstonensis]AZG74702.1 hypothetical protein EGC82_19260 [Shewanella livingstonensis]
MQTSKQWALMPLLGLSYGFILIMTSSVSAQPSLANEYSNRVSHSVGSQHNRHRQHNNHGQYNNHYRNPWRWGLGWDQGWGINQGWGPSIGFSWSNGNNLRYGSAWGNDDYRRSRYGFSPYSNLSNSGYQSQHIEVVDTVVVAPPSRTTTSIEYASGLSQLPENAKVIQRANGTVYEWQGVEYYFDWSTQTYEVAKADTP